MVKSEPAKQQM